VLFQACAVHEDHGRRDEELEVLRGKLKGMRIGILGD
jgi:hypothetical protein